MIDTGIRRTHNCLKNVTVEAGRDYTGQGFGIASDYIGHGTFAASLVSGTLQNEEDGMEKSLGIATDAVLVPLKCFESQNADTHLLAQAVYDAVDVFQCDIIQMSWGTSKNSEELFYAVSYAVDKGVILVAAAGNDGSEELYYPAAYEDVLGVGAVDTEGNMASYSVINKSMDIAASGTFLTGAGHTSDQALVTRSGTSYAVSYVTAAIALALEIKPDLTVLELKNALLETAGKTMDEYMCPVLDTEKFLIYISEM